MRLAPQSIRLRLTLWYAAALTLIVLCFAVAVYLMVQRSLLRQAAAQLDRDTAVLRKIVEHDLDELHEVDEHGLVMHFQVLAPGGTASYESADWRKADIDPARAKREPGRLDHWHAPSGRTFLLRTDTVTVPAGQRPSELLPA